VGNSDFDIIFLINTGSIGSQKEREEEKMEENTCAFNKKAF
jgi:hypothetical protein